MSRLPPVPPASQPTYGPGAIPKTFTDDPAHFEAQEPDLIRGHLHRDAGDDPRHFFTGDDLGGSVRADNSSRALPLLVFGAIVAMIVWLAGKRR